MTYQAALAHRVPFDENDVIGMLRSPSQLHLAFQPQVNLETGKIASAEALARWRHPTLGSIEPGQFVPMLHTCRLQDALFRRVVSLTLAAATALREAGHPLPLAINACATTLTNPKNVDFLLDEAARRAVEPSQLKIELTEDTRVSNIAALKTALHRLQDWGCCVCIDDFGVGHANLSLLLSLPLDELKIDREFAARIGDSQLARQCIRFALELGKSMGWRVVAEGVATLAQRKALYAMGCRYGQGFLLGRPMELAALIALLGMPQDNTHPSRPALQDA